MDIIVSPWCPLYFSEASTFMILYRIKGIHLSGHHLKSVHTFLPWLVTLIWHVCPSCSSKSSPRIYQTCFSYFEASFHDSLRGPRWFWVWYGFKMMAAQKNLQHWRGQPCSGNGARQMASRCPLWLKVSGHAAALWAKSVRSLPLSKQNLSPTQRLSHNGFSIPDGQGEQAGKEKLRLEWS